MRSHQTIIRDFGADKLHDLLPVKPSIYTVRSWEVRGSIPAQWWAALVGLNVATLDELAKAAPQRKRSRQDQAA